MLMCICSGLFDNEYTKFLVRMPMYINVMIFFLIQSLVQTIAKLVKLGDRRIDRIRKIDLFQILTVISLLLQMNVG